jgi:hypothetical protein
VLGQTEAARDKKSVERGAWQWDEASFFAAIRERRGEQEQEAAVARRLLEWATEHRLSIWWGQGKQDGSFFPSYTNKFGQHLLFSVWTYGRVELQFQHMKVAPFADEAKRKELAGRLTAIGLAIPEDALTKRPSFGLSLLIEPAALAKFLDAFDWALSEIRKVESAEGADSLQSKAEP